ncbi:MAG: hypothetical protein ACI82I_002854, partial [Gammaproteobacteria bacterium]
SCVHVTWIGVVMQFLDSIPLNLLLLACLTLGLAPFFPEPHIWEKLKMLLAGDMRKPNDIFDMLMHGVPWLILLARLARMALRG